MHGSWSGVELQASATERRGLYTSAAENASVEFVKIMARE